MRLVREKENKGVLFEDVVGTKHPDEPINEFKRQKINQDDFSKLLEKMEPGTGKSNTLEIGG